MSSMRRRAAEGLKPGDTLSISRTFSEQDTIRFADISRDYNPVHFDDRFAKAKSYERRVCHGLLIAGMITEIGGQIGWLASGMDFRFKKPVYFGDTIQCDFTITDIDERGRAKASAVFRNGDGTIVLEAVITGFLPGDREQRIMKDMLSEGDPTNRITR
jgi:3-hydroxybutyryl-CoA dehydratase